MWCNMAQLFGIFQTLTPLSYQTSMLITKKRHLFKVALYCRQTLTKAGGVVVGSFLRWCYLRRVLIMAAITSAALTVYTSVFSVLVVSLSMLTLVFISLALMALVNASNIVGGCAILERVCAGKGVYCFGLLYFSLNFGCLVVVFGVFAWVVCGL